MTKNEMEAKVRKTTINLQDVLVENRRLRSTIDLMQQEIHKVMTERKKLQKQLMVFQSRKKSTNFASS